MWLQECQSPHPLWGTVTCFLIKHAKQLLCNIYLKIKQQQKLCPNIFFQKNSVKREFKFKLRYKNNFRKSELWAMHLKADAHSHGLTQKGVMRLVFILRNPKWHSMKKAKVYTLLGVCRGFLEGAEVSTTARASSPSCLPSPSVPCMVSFALWRTVLFILINQLIDQLHPPLKYWNFLVMLLEHIRIAAQNVFPIYQARAVQSTESFQASETFCIML